MASRKKVKASVNQEITPRFEKLENASVILRNSGSYRPADLYLFGDEVFAKRGQGFIKLLPSNMTTARTVSWSHTITPNGSIQLVGGFIRYIPAKHSRIRAVT